MTSSSSLKSKHCVPCEGGVPRVDAEQARKLAGQLDGWSVSDDGILIHREWKLKDFASAVEFLNAIGDLAEAEQHHPDLHLTGYRNIKIELTTHAIGGLSENDFILAAKIDELPIKLKK